MDSVIVIFILISKCNISHFVIQSDPSARYPVMVFVHGGSYQVGAGNHFDGSVPAQYDTVVVVINYRLGPFGR